MFRKVFVIGFIKIKEPFTKFRGTKMTRYHFSELTNKPMLCSAQPGNCKYGESLHGDTPGEAMKKYEETMQDKTIVSLTQSKVIDQLNYEKLQQAKKQKEEKEARDKTYNEAYEAYLVSKGLPLNTKSAYHTEKAHFAGEEAVYESYKNEPSYDKRVVTIYDEDYEQAIKNIEKANRKLERYGIEDRFKYESKEIIKTSTTYDKDLKRVIAYDYIMHEITFERPKIALNGYEFQAALTREGDSENGGFITKSAPGVEFNGERPEKMVCEHCGNNRKRSKTYLVKGPDGQIKQIGSSCLEAYMGVRVKGLEFFDNDVVQNNDDEENSLSGSSKRPALNVDSTLAIALAITDNGKNYVSSRSENSTASKYDIVANNFSRRSPSELAYADNIFNKADEILKTNAVEDLKNKIIESKSNNDYIKNLQVLVANDSIRDANKNLLISAVSIIAGEEREKKRDAEYQQKKLDREKAEAERNAQFSGGYFKSIQEKFKNETFKVMDTKPYNTVDYYGNDVTKYVTTLRSSDGHRVVVYANDDYNDYKDDDGNVLLTSGAIKDHTEYKGENQTILTNARLKKPKNKDM